MKYFSTLLLLLLPQVNFGQAIHNLSGKIIDEHNIPISNVHIQINDTNIGVISNTQGDFNIKIPIKYCNLDIVFSHIGYISILKKIICNQQNNLIILSEKEFRLNEVQISALSVERIVLNSILNLKKNYQVNSVSYTMFSRLTEQIGNDPLLIEEFVFDLYHGNKTKPEFHVVKARGSGFNQLGKQRFDETRLVNIHSTASHMMLRYTPDFLQEKKMKKYEYILVDEISSGEDAYFVITITSINSNKYQKGGIIHVSKDDFGISYVKTIFKDEEWRNMSKTNIIDESHYLRDNDKWFFSHGKEQQIWYLKNEGVSIKSSKIIVATNRTGIRTFEKIDEMGLMVQMFKDLKGNFDDDFWDQYSYIPLDENFERSLAGAKTP